MALFWKRSEICALRDHDGILFSYDEMKVNMTKVLKSLDWQCVVHKLDVLSRVVLVMPHRCLVECLSNACFNCFLWFLSSSRHKSWLCWAYSGYTGCACACACACLTACLCRCTCICVKVVRVRIHHVKVYEVSIVKCVCFFISSLHSNILNVYLT